MRGKDLLEGMEHIDDALIEEALNPAVIPWYGRVTAKWGMAAACLIVIGISAAALWSHQNIRKEYREGMEHELVSPQNNAAADNGADMAENTNNDQALPSTGSSQSGGMAQDMNGDDVYTAESADENKILQPDNEKAADLAESQSVMQESLKERHTVISSYSGKDNAAHVYTEPEKGEILCYTYLQEAMEYYSVSQAETDCIGTDYAYAVVIDVFGDIDTEDGIHYEKLNLTNAGNELIEQEYRRLIDLGYSVRLSEDFVLMGTFTKDEIDTFDALSAFGYVFRFEDEE